MDEQQRRDPLPRGHLLKHYCIERELGAGGFGITYLAYDTRLKRQVAIKELLPMGLAFREQSMTVKSLDEDEADFCWARNRFLDEAIILARFSNHQNVVTVVEHFEMHGTAYMVTLFEECQTLTEWLRERKEPLNEATLRRIFIPLLDALEAIHNGDFLHRDIKPGNILICRQNERPFLIDFGSARQAIGRLTTDLTVVLSPSWAPSELYKTDGNQGAWTDIYSLGAVLVFAISGQKLPDAEKRLPEAQDQVNVPKDPYIPLMATEYRGRFPDRLLNAIDRAVSREVSARPQSIADWRKELGWDVDPVTVPPVVKKLSPLVMAAIIVMALVLVSGGAYVLYETWVVKEVDQDYLKSAQEHANRVEIGQAFNDLNKVFEGDNSAAQTNARTYLNEWIELWLSTKPDVADQSDMDKINVFQPRLMSEAGDYQKAKDLQGQLENNFAEKSSRDSALKHAEEVTDSLSALPLLDDACRKYSAYSGKPENELIGRLTEIDLNLLVDISMISSLEKEIVNIRSGTQRSRRVTEKLDDLEEVLGKKKNVIKLINNAKRAVDEKAWATVVIQYFLAAKEQASDSRLGSDAKDELNKHLGYFTESTDATQRLDDDAVQSLFKAKELGDNLTGLESSTLGLENASRFVSFMRAENEEINALGVKLKEITDAHVFDLGPVDQARVSRNNQNWRSSIDSLSQQAANHSRRSGPRSALNNICKDIAWKLEKKIDKDLRRQEVENPTINILIKQYKENPPLYGYAALIVAEALAFDQKRMPEALAAAQAAWKSDSKCGRGAVLYCMILSMNQPNDNQVQDIVDVAIECMADKDTEKDDTEKDRWVECAFVAGDAVVRLVSEGRPAPDLRGKSITYFLNQSVFADERFAFAELFLGRVYSNGWLGVARNLDTGIMHFENAKDKWVEKFKSDTNAEKFWCHRLLGEALLESYSELEKQNPEKAAEVLARAEGIHKEGASEGDELLIFAWAADEARKNGLIKNNNQLPMSIQNRVKTALQSARANQDRDALKVYDKLINEYKTALDEP